MMTTMNFIAVLTSAAWVQTAAATVLEGGPNRPEQPPNATGLYQVPGFDLRQEYPGAS